ncbi:MULTISPECIES: acyltransferase [unclassified Frankia]|uniref:acyltransferase n=1 Tax=unclassified Frankia TaxID=2632575 RepID=UPI00202462BE
MRRGKLWEQLKLEFWMLVQGTIVNGIGGSFLVPRPLRFLLYRLGGVRTRTMNIMPGSIVGHRASFGRGTAMASRCFIENSARVRIGERVKISPQVTILTSTHDVVNGEVSSTVVPKPVVIDDDCWLGGRVTVMPGVTIGHHCVIATGALVNKDCKPYGLYAGSPARRVRDITPEEPAAPLASAAGSPAASAPQAAAVSPAAAALSAAPVPAESSAALVSPAAGLTAAQPTAAQPIAGRTPAR